MRGIVSPVARLQPSSPARPRRPSRARDMQKTFDELTTAEKTAAKTRRQEGVQGEVARQAQRLRRSRQHAALRHQRRRLPEQDRRGARQGARRAGSIYFWRPYLERGLTRETFDTNDVRRAARHARGLRAGADDHPDLPLDLRARLSQRPRPRHQGLRRSGAEGPEDRRLPDFEHPPGADASAASRQPQAARRSATTPTSIPRTSRGARCRTSSTASSTSPACGDRSPAGCKTMKGEPIVIQPVNLWEDVVPLEFELAAGVRKTDVRAQVHARPGAREPKDEIEKILTDYGVPLVQCSNCVVQGDLPSHGAYIKPPVDRIQVEARGRVARSGRDRRRSSRPGSRKVPISRRSFPTPSSPARRSASSSSSARAPTSTRSIRRATRRCTLRRANAIPSSSRCSPTSRPISTCPTATA